jgi:hypothetical protein
MATNNLGGGQGGYESLDMEGEEKLLILIPLISFFSSAP